MKKSLLFVPIALIALSACTISGGGGGKKRKSSSEPASTATTTNPTDPTTVPTTTASPTEPPSKSIPTVTAVPVGPDEYQGYRKILTTPENDKTYIYGIYQANNDKCIFLNGYHHVDEKGEYPYYLTTTDDVSKAVKIRCHYANETHFSIQIIGGGEFDYYDGKYLEVYEGEKADGTKITSLRAADNSAANWYFLPSYTRNGVTTILNTNCMNLQSEGYNEQPVTMATYDSYETFSACTPNHFEDNFISHLWEAIE